MLAMGSGSAGRGTNKGSFLKVIASKVNQAISSARSSATTRKTSSSGYSGNNSYKNYSSSGKASGSKTEVLDFSNISNIKSIASDLNKIVGNMEGTDAYIKKNSKSNKGSLTTSQRQTIVNFAKKIGETGLPYNAGSGPAGAGGLWANDFPEVTVINGVRKEAMLSCNGLVHWAYKKAGVDIPQGSNDQMINAPYVTSNGKVSDMSPGDIIVFDANPINYNDKEDYAYNLRNSNIEQVDKERVESNNKSGNLKASHHVALYLGDGKMSEEVNPNARIREIKDYEYSYSVTW